MRQGNVSALGVLTTGKETLLIFNNIRGDVPQKGEEWFLSDADPSARVAELEEEVSELKREVQKQEGFVVHHRNEAARARESTFRYAQQASAHVAALNEEVENTHEQVGELNDILRVLGCDPEFVEGHWQGDIEGTTIQHMLVEARAEGIAEGQSNAGMFVPPEFHIADVEAACAEAVADYVRRLGAVLEDCRNLTGQLGIPPITKSSCEWFVGWTRLHDNKGDSNLFAHALDPLAAAKSLCDTLAREAEEDALTDAGVTVSYRKKPVVVEAHQTQERMKIKTLEGTMVAEPGDWIITGVRGEQYPCKPDIFAETYELATAPTDTERVANEARSVAAQQDNVSELPELEFTNPEDGTQ